jgi:hypothetical protein
MNTLGTLGLLVAFILGVILLFFGKRLRRIGYVVTGGVVAVLAFLVYQVHHLDHADGDIQIGASKADVLAAQGRPTVSTDCSTTYGGYALDKPVPGCAQVLWYYSFLTPEAWEYSFDVNGRLIHKYHWQSP